MRPLKDYILLGEVKEDLKTESGLILTASVETGNKPGKILAIGPEVADVEVGQHVICNWKPAIPVSVEGVQCVLLQTEHIIAVTKEV